jgi:hypothetical protein
MKQIFSAVLRGIRAVPALRNWFRQRRRKSTQKRLAARFNRLVLQNKLVIEYSEIISGLLIALDRKNKKLLVIERSKNNRQQHCVPLTAVSTVSVARETDQKGGIQKVFLVLKQKRSGKTVRICFFNNAFNNAAELLRLSRCALHWKSRVELYKSPGSFFRGQMNPL